MQSTGRRIGHSMSALPEVGCNAIETRMRVDVRESHWPFSAARVS